MPSARSRHDWIWDPAACSEGSRIALQLVNVSEWSVPPSLSDCGWLNPLKAPGSSWEENKDIGRQQTKPLG